MQHILAELHCHTQLLGWQPFSQRLQWFLERGRGLGLGILAITEHAELRNFWRIYEALEEIDWRWRDLLVLAGAEVTVREGGDFLVLGAPEGSRS